MTICQGLPPRRYLRRAWVTAVLIAAVVAATSVLAQESGTFTGRVVGVDGAPVAGAMVTAAHPKFLRSTTVFTDWQGRFRLPPLAVAAYSLRVRRIGYQDLEWSNLYLAPGLVDLDLTMQLEPDRQALAWQLPASRWLALLLARLSSDDHREEFIRQCVSCHQQGNRATRAPRSDEDWAKIFKLMGRMGGFISANLRAELPSAFNSVYEDEAYLDALVPDGSAPPAGPQGKAGKAVITEWDLGDHASTQNDLVVHPDGNIYSVDTNRDRLYRLNPRSNERKSWAIPRGDSPLGGVFAGSGLLLAQDSEAHLAPRSLQAAPDGSLWVALCLGNKIGRFDPSTGQWEIIEQEAGLCPDTLRFDDGGRIWYTLAVSNHIGVLDPRTGQRGTVSLPTRTLGREIALRLAPVFLRVAEYVSLDVLLAGGRVGLAAPTGIDVAPDGGVWFSQLNERRIGRMDPEYGTIEMIDTPFGGPHGLRFDSKGNLWIAGFSAGVVARYTPSTRKIDTWKLPIEGVETPHGLNVDRRTDTVWICGTNSDTLIRFEPNTEQFAVYPLPTRVTYTRAIEFDELGAVWTSNASFPAWHIEGRVPKVIRIELDAARVAE